MKKIILLAAVLLPLTVLANNGITFKSNINCEDITNPDERKDCLIIAKKKEADEKYRNFKKNNHGAQLNDDF